MNTTTTSVSATRYSRLEYMLFSSPVTAAPSEVERADPDASVALRVIREIRAPQRHERVAEERQERTKERPSADEPRRHRQVIQLLGEGVRDRAAQRALREVDVGVG